MGNKKKFIEIKQIKGVNGGGKTWDKRIKNKNRSNKSQKQHKTNNKANRDTKSNNGVHLVDGKCMCLYSKGCGFNTSHNTGLRDTRSACVKNNQPFTFPANHVFQKKMVEESGTVPQFASNNGGGTQSPPPINSGTDTDPVEVLHHMGTAILVSQYEV